MRKFLPIFLVSALLFGGAGCTLFGSNSQIELTPVTIEYWRTDDAPETLSELFAAYKRLHPNVDVVYRQMRSEDYERLLIEALAENRGPDIFSIPNVSLGGWRDKTIPVPKETSVATQVVNDKKQIVTVLQKTPGLNILQFRNAYVEGVTRELIASITEEGKAAEDRILGLPLSADTLGLYYNKDILTKGGFEKPPATWRDLQEYAQKLTVRPADAPISITQSGAALGLAANVDYYTDILSALMMQNGAVMAEDSGYATFSQFSRTSSGGIYPPGVEALIFYQSFSVPGTPAYSWNSVQPRSYDAFIAGKAAFYFGLPIDLAKIRAAAPRLNVGVAPLPQVDPTRPVNLLHYPVEVVSKRTQNADVAWDLVQFLAAQEQVSQFLALAKRPTAHRGLIAGQLTDSDVGPFAGQVLTAKAWYKGNDYSKVQAAFKNMIEARPTTERPEYQPIVAQAEDMVNQTIGF